MGGSTAGHLAMTFYTKDGRLQLPMSATLSIKDISEPAGAMFTAVETVFCSSSSLPA
jgi:D-alanyl-D-alanine carboxypeptidase